MSTPSAESVTSIEEDLVKEAAKLLQFICQQRNDMLMNSLQFLMKFLTAPIAKASYIVGALRMLGNLAEMIAMEPKYHQPTVATDLIATLRVGASQFETREKYFLVEFFS